MRSTFFWRNSLCIFLFVFEKQSREGKLVIYHTLTVIFFLLFEKDTIMYCRWFLAVFSYVAFLAIFHPPFMKKKKCSSFLTSTSLRLKPIFVACPCSNLVFSFFWNNNLFLYPSLHHFLECMEPLNSTLGEIVITFDVLSLSIESRLEMHGLARLNEIISILSFYSVFIVLFFNCTFLFAVENAYFQWQ